MVLIGLVWQMSFDCYMTLRLSTDRHMDILVLQLTYKLFALFMNTLVKVSFMSFHDHPSIDSSLDFTL